MVLTAIIRARVKNQTLSHVTRLTEVACAWTVTRVSFARVCVPTVFTEVTASKYVRAEMVLLVTT